VPSTLHGPISTGAKHNRRLFRLWWKRKGVLQIVDREKLLNGPKEPTPENLAYPQIARWTSAAIRRAHDRFPCSAWRFAEFAEDKDARTPISSS